MHSATESRRRTVASSIKCGEWRAGIAARPRQARGAVVSPRGAGGAGSSSLARLWCLPLSLFSKCTLRRLIVLYRCTAVLAVPRLNRALSADYSHLHIGAVGRLQFACSHVGWHTTWANDSHRFRIHPAQQKEDSGMCSNERGWVEERVGVGEL